jgi:RNA polymerase sigma factor (TIGR02999 family)
MDLSPQKTSDVTELLIAWSGGDSDAFNRLVPLIYDELRKRAKYHLRRERPNHTLQTTALVHEAYVKLKGQHDSKWKNRGQFFWLASQIMRRILVDYARGRSREKRGGEIDIVSMESNWQIVVENSAVDLVLLDEVLERLATFDPQQAKVVEMRFFGGCSIEETAEAMNVSVTTVKRDWAVAKAWLKLALER